MIKYKDYIDERLKKKPELAKQFWNGYEDFKNRVPLKEASINSEITKQKMTQKINTTKSVISRIENHAKDIRLSTLEKFVKALGRKMTISIE